MKNLKVWWVLAWDQYYPKGSLDNVRSTHSSFEEAEGEISALRAAFDNVEIINISDKLGIDTTNSIYDGEDE